MKITLAVAIVLFQSVGVASESKPCALLTAERKLEDDRLREAVELHSLFATLTQMSSSNHVLDAETVLMRKDSEESVLSLRASLNRLDEKLKTCIP